MAIFSKSAYEDRSPECNSRESCGWRPVFGDVPWPLALDSSPARM
jgi:hypothetical protein